MEQLQEFTISACDAEVEEVDAKTGSFTGFNDMKPKVIRVDFGRLPEGGRERSKAIMENGIGSSAQCHARFNMLMRNRLIPLLHHFPPPNP